MFKLLVILFIIKLYVRVNIYYIPFLISVFMSAFISVYILYILPFKEIAIINLGT